jgi:hypothetical protein
VKTWRTGAPWLAALTLVVQVSVIALASGMLCCIPDQATAHAEDMVQDSAGAHHECAEAQAPDPAAPQLTSCCDMDQAALAVLSIYDAPIEPRYESHVAAAGRTMGRIDDAQPLALTLPPDAPPPRA